MSWQTVFVAILSIWNLKADPVVFRFCFFRRLLADLNVIMLPNPDKPEPD